LRVSYSAPAIERYVAQLARRYNRTPRSAEVIGATTAGPLIRDGKAGLAVEQATLRAAIAQQLASGVRKPLELLTDPVMPSRTAANLGPVIVIDRGSNTLKLY